MDAELKTKLEEAKSESKIYQEKNHFYKKKHILDPSIDITLKDIEAFGALKNDALREALAERHIELQKLPNSERATFGRASDAYAYIASRQSPQEALNGFQKLRKTYPNHPSYRNVDQNGQNPTIKKILEKMDR